MSSTGTIYIRSGAVDAEQVEAVARAPCGSRRPAAAGRRADRRLARRPAAAPGTRRRSGGTPARCPRGSGRPGAARAAGGAATTRGNSASARSSAPSFSWVSSAGSNRRRRPRRRGRRRCAGSRPIRACGVLHVEDRVVAGLRGDLLDVEGQRRVDREARQRVAQRVDADQVDQLRSVTSVPARLRQPDLLAAAAGSSPAGRSSPRRCGPGRRRRRRPSRAAGRRSRGGRRRAGRCSRSKPRPRLSR